MKTIEAYRNIVEKRKTCSLCEGLRNPAAVEGHYDGGQIGPWSLWQANLSAQVVVVGQDWGDIAYFEKWQGRDQPSGNPTNENLQILLRNIGIEIGKPRDPQDQIVFLTNLILCLKTGGLQARVYDDWFANCSKAFFKPLVEIINPKVIIGLGKKPSEAILTLYDLSYSKSSPFSSMVDRSPYPLNNQTVLFPVYHCGAGSVNRNRKLSQQKEDWLKIKTWLSEQGLSLTRR